MSCLRVLVVENHPEIARLIELVLGRSGCLTVVTESGGDAAAAMRRERFDVVVVDAFVRLGDGFVLEHLAAHHADLLPRTVVMTTACANPTMMERLRAIGPCVILPKPFEIAQLCEAVSQTCASPLPELSSPIERRFIERCEL
jgi:CheY-like chemotaxis protein